MPAEDFQTTGPRRVAKGNIFERPRTSFERPRRYKYAHEDEDTLAVSLHTTNDGTRNKL